MSKHFIAVVKTANKAKLLTSVQIRSNAKYYNNTSQSHIWHKIAKNVKSTQNTMGRTIYVNYNYGLIKLRNLEKALKSTCLSKNKITSGSHTGVCEIEKSDVNQYCFKW